MQSENIQSNLDKIMQIVQNLDARMNSMELRQKEMADIQNDIQNVCLQTKQTICEENLQSQLSMLATQIAMLRKVSESQQIITRNTNKHVPQVIESKKIPSQEESKGGDERLDTTLNDDTQSVMSKTSDNIVPATIKKTTVKPAKQVKEKSTVEKTFVETHFAFISKSKSLPDMLVLKVDESEKGALQEESTLLKSENGGIGKFPQKMSQTFAVKLLGEVNNKPDRYPILNRIVTRLFVKTE